MKKILAGMLALSLLSGNLALAAGDPVKKGAGKTTKKECKKTDCCKDKKDCPKPCPPICN